MAKLFDKATGDVDTLKKMGDAIISQFTTLKSHVHIWLVSASLHAIEHGDYTEIPRVLNELGDGFKRKAVYQWLTLKKKELGSQSLPFVWVLKDGETPAHLKLDTEAVKPWRARYLADKDGVTALILGCQPWYKFDMKNEEIRPFDLPAEIAKLVKRATAAAADEKIKANPKTNLAGLSDLVAFQARKPAKHISQPAIVPTEEDDGSDAAPAAHPTIQ